MLWRTVAIEPRFRDLVGARGEAIFFAAISRFHPSRGIMFRPQFLGDKWPTADFIVELLGTRHVKPFFFVQVRTTHFAVDATRRLPVQVNRSTIFNLAQYPAPTYIAGIDSQRKLSYLVSANGEVESGTASISRTFPLDDDGVLEALWAEVSAFWPTPAQPKLASAFVDAHWSAL
jgi:hypothetical protein